MTYSTILIAVDGSKCSMNAVQKGIELAKDLSANAILLSVIDVTNIITNAALGASISNEIEALYKKEATQVLETALKKYPYDKVTLVVEEGIPKESINIIAEQRKANLIVMGTHGRTGLHHLLIGSVAEQVIRHSKVPVMVISSSEE